MAKYAITLSILEVLLFWFSIYRIYNHHIILVPNAYIELSFYQHELLLFLEIIYLSKNKILYLRQIFIKASFNCRHTTIEQKQQFIQDRSENFYRGPSNCQSINQSR